MLPTSRKRRTDPLRRTLTLEILEQRTLPDGVVTASLDVPTGLLQITGDNGDNQFTMTLAPTPGQLRLFGALGSYTYINGEAFADFSLSAITDIRITLQTGQDNVTIRGFSIPGDLTVHYGNRADSFTMSNFAARDVNFLFSGLGSDAGHSGLLPPAGGGSGSGNNAGLLPTVGGGSGNGSGLLPPPQANSIDVTGVTARTFTLVPGWNGGLASLSKSTLGTANLVLLGLGITRTTVLESSIGNLMITTGNGNDDTIVAGCQLAQATLTSGRGEDIILVTGCTFTRNSGPPTLHVAVAGSPQFQAITLADLVFSTPAPNLPPSGSVSVSGGHAIPVNGELTPSTLNLSQVAGVDTVTVQVGNNWTLVALDTVAARSVTTTVGDNLGNLTLNALTVAGTLSVTVGANAQTVQLSNITTFASPTDQAAGRLADVNLTLGHGAQSVALDTFQVGRDLTVTNGDCDTVFRIGNGLVGRNLTLTTGHGNNDIRLEAIRVLDRLFVRAGSGCNSVSTAGVTSARGLLDGGSGPSNAYWDQGGNAGFDVINFAIFLP